jgi:hypothetical protein
MDQCQIGRMAQNGGLPKPPKRPRGLNQWLETHGLVGMVRCRGDNCRNSEASPCDEIVGDDDGLRRHERRAVEYCSLAIAQYAIGQALARSRDEAGAEVYDAA